MAVSTPHNQYADMLIEWECVRDSCDPRKIKERREFYLPKLADDKDNPERYNDYLNRAYYINVTGRTRDGLTGAAFRRDPVVEVPSTLDYVHNDADGAGIGLEQLSKRVLSEVMETGRYGLLADYPQSDEGGSREDTAGVQAYIAGYAAENIINWRYTTESGRLKLCLVVLTEQDKEDVDEFEYHFVDRYRVLRLRDGVYTQQLYDKSCRPIDEEYAPRQSDGSTWNHIPFSFVGAIDNRPDIGPVPLYSIAQINIAQYRNIADREETLHIAGQPTLFLTSDIDVAGFKEANPNGVMVGARKGHFLGANGNAILLQAQAVDAHDVAINAKAEQMVSVGARLITSSTVQQTAEASRIAASGEHSVLSTMVGNVSECIESALQDVARFMGGETEEITYQISREFWDKAADPQMIMQLIQLADRNDIARSDVRQYARSTNIIDPSRTDEEIDGEIAAQTVL